MLRPAPPALAVCNFPSVAASVRHEAITTDSRTPHDAASDGGPGNEVLHALALASTTSAGGRHGQRRDGDITGSRYAVTAAAAAPTDEQIDALFDDDGDDADDAGGGGRVDVATVSAARRLSRPLGHLQQRGSSRGSTGAVRGSDGGSKQATGEHRTALDMQDEDMEDKQLQDDMEDEHVHGTSGAHAIAGGNDSGGGGVLRPASLSSKRRRVIVDEDDDDD